MLQRVLFVWAALAVGTIVGCGGGGAGTGGGGNATSSSSSSGTGGTGGTPPACGDGTVDTGEECDDGNTTAGDGCGECKVEKGYTCNGGPSTCTTTCGDGIVAGVEACDDGNGTAGDGCSATCAIEPGYSCTGTPSVCTPGCGDGIVAGAEACDDGNGTAGDGCDDKCAVESGWDCGTMQPSVCVSVCGDGIITGAEACDDGNTTAGDGCDDKCAVETGYDCGSAAPSVCATVCGDGVIAGAETCDDSNGTAGDGCDDKCAVETGYDCGTAQPSICATICGDGVIAGAETCDDGNTTTADGCDDTCAVETGYDCGTVQPSLCATICGDGIITGTEQCDDGNGTAGDGCDAACAIEVGWDCAGAPSICTTTCGDGVIAGQEKCDDGNTADGDGCSAACAIDAGYACTGAPSTCSTICGDGIVVAGKEQCDDGNKVSADGCSATCTAELGFTCTGAPSTCTTTCGDGITAGAEQCDDGNTASGDGCSATCAPETGYGCSGSPSTCSPVCGDGIKLPSEKCDDGNLVNGDCCSSTCQVEAGCEIESNNTAATANDFAALSVANKIKGLITPTADNDMFLVVVPQGATANLTAQTTTGALGTQCADDTSDPKIAIYAANGTTQLGSDDDSGDGWCPLLTLNNLAPGNYYVEVKKSSAGVSTFDYVLQIDLALMICGNGVVEGPEQCDDGNTANGDGCSSLCKMESVPEAEPNNTCATANGPYDLPPNVLVSASCNTAGDQDWFKFTLPNFADVELQTFDASGPGSCASIDTEMQVFKSDCTTSLGAAVDQNGLNNCTRIDPVTYPYMKHVAPGTYYVKVFPFSSTATYNYTLLMSLKALCGNGVVEGSEQCDGGPFCNVDCTALPLGNGGIGGGITGSALPKLGIATTAGTYSTLVSKLQATGSFSTVDYLSASSTWTVAQLKAYDALIVYTFGATSATFGDNLATYFESGGGVVLFDYETQENTTSGLSGQYETLYALSTKISSSSWLTNSFTLGTILEPASPLMTGVTTFKSASTSGYRLPASAFNKNNPIIVASYTDGSPAVVRGVVASGPAAGRNLVEINCYGSASPASTLGWDGATDGDKLVRNAVLFSMPPPVISVAKGLDLGAQAVSTAGPSHALTYTNASSAPQTITALNITGASAGDFAAVPSSGLPVTIPPGGTFVVDVIFAPSAAGARNATLGATFTGFANPATTLLVGAGI